VLNIVLYVLLAVLVAVVLFMLAARFLPAGEHIAPPLRDDPLWELPEDTQVSADEIEAIRLPVALRGYRFAETDALLDLLARQLRQRDQHLAQLRTGGAAGGVELEHAAVTAETGNSESSRFQPGQPVPGYLGSEDTRFEPAENPTGPPAYGGPEPVL
jgi:uncharacterized membrane-anchored protein YhcB (DUF1043 family)